MRASSPSKLCGSQNNIRNPDFAARYNTHHTDNLCDPVDEEKDTYDSSEDSGDESCDEMFEYDSMGASGNCVLKSEIDYDLVADACSPRLVKASARAVAGTLESNDNLKFLEVSSSSEEIISSDEEDGRADPFLKDASVAPFKGMRLSTTLTPTPIAA